jgi:hypothetical protein
MLQVSFAELKVIYVLCCMSAFIGRAVVKKAIKLDLDFM